MNSKNVYDKESRLKDISERKKLIEEFMRQSEAEIACVIHLYDISAQMKGESE